MTIQITIDEKELRKLVAAEIEAKLGTIPLDLEGIKIMVKSKQNYKSEWEIAAFKAEYNHTS